jgi:uncharacterized protein YbjT (DUF2867 family)
MNHILIIGSTGTVGRRVVSGLEAAGVQVRTLLRNPAAARFPLQIEVVRGDLTPETLDACLHGIDTVFLVWTAPAGAVAPALERIAKHARRIVFLSAPLKTPHPLLLTWLEFISAQIEAEYRDFSFQPNRSQYAGP